MSEPATPGSPEGDLLEVAAIAAAVALLAATVLRIVRAANGVGEWLCVGMALPLGYPFARRSRHRHGPLGGRSDR